MSSFFLKRAPFNLHYFKKGTPKKGSWLWLHGGPGHGCNESSFDYFNLEEVQVVLVDQRGAARSRPSNFEGSIRGYDSLREENTLHHLIEDLEAIRQELEIDQWSFVASSWGSTLGLSYAKKHPKTISAMLFKSPFIFDLDGNWLCSEGPPRLFPEEWEEFLSQLNSEERQSPAESYAKRVLFSKDLEERKKYATHWIKWLSRAFSPDEVPQELNPHYALQLATIQLHYFAHRCFIETPLLSDLEALQEIPCQIYHGSHDLLCPPDHGWRLSQALKSSKWYLVKKAGHSSHDPLIAKPVKEGIQALTEAMS